MRSRATKNVLVEVIVLLGLVPGCATSLVDCSNAELWKPVVPQENREVTCRVIPTPTLSKETLEAEKPLSERGHDFSKGTREFNTYGSVALGDSGKGEMYALHAGVSYFVRDYWSIGLDALGAYIRSGIDDNGVAAGFDLLLRRHFCVDESDLWSLYVDSGAGLQQQSTNYSGSRHFNFRLMGGLGGTLRIVDQTRILAGLRYLHSSDAGIKGGGGGFDGFQLYSGFAFRF